MRLHRANIYDFCEGDQYIFETVEDRDMKQPENSKGTH
jgi:hypothetical protein